MAKFEGAFKRSKVNEGGYVNDPHDLGGETYRGIARKYHPEWTGFKLIDAMKKVSPIKYNFVSDELDKLAEGFYKEKYWNPIQLDNMASQLNAEQIYDCSLSGLPRTKQMIKHLLNSEFGGKFVLDSTITPDVIVKVNSVDQKRFHDGFKVYREILFKYSAGELSPAHSLYSFFYKWNKASEAKRKENGRYLKGWLNRVNKYKMDVADAITNAAKDAGKTISENKGTAIGVAVFFLQLL